MKRCKVCNQRIAFGAYEDGDEAFCSLPCLTASPLGGFCEDCSQATNSDATGHTFLVSGIGSRLMGQKNRCPTCHSIEQREWFWLLFPIVALERYRCLYATQTRYVGRAVIEGRGDEDDEDDAADGAD